MFFPARLGIIKFPGNGFIRGYLEGPASIGVGNQGQMDDSIDFIELSNDYQHYLVIRFEIERQIQNAA